MKTNDPQTGTPPLEDFAELENTLRDALRLGPGGLRDDQRLRVMNAARRIEQQPVPMLAATPGFGRRGLGLAAAAALIISGILVFMAANLRLGAPPPVAQTGEPSEWLVNLAPAAETIRANTAAMPHPGFLATRDSHVALLRPNVAVEGFESLRRQLREEGRMPQPESLAIDEMINYVHSGDSSLAREGVIMTAEAGPCPWNPELRLVHVVLSAGGDVPGEPVARDLTLSVDFNPQRVSGYRLIGKVVNTSGPSDARGADLAAGQSATLMYEIAPASVGFQSDGTWHSGDTRPGAWSARADLVAVRAEFTAPGGDGRQAREARVAGWEADLASTSETFQFSAAVAWAGRLLEGDPAATGRYADAIRLAANAMRHDPDGRKAEFVGLVRRAERLSAQP